MVVMCCEVELYLPSSRSLKDKRQVVSSLKGRVAHRFAVVIAEIEHQDLWQRGRLGLVTVSASARHAEQVISKALRYIEDDLRVQVIDSFIEER